MRGKYRNGGEMNTKFFPEVIKGSLLGRHSCTWKLLLNLNEIKAALEL
jgi:hypothetical protein